MREAIGEGAAPAAIDNPGLKGSWREVEATLATCDKVRIPKEYPVAIETPVVWRCQYL